MTESIPSFHSFWPVQVIQFWECRKLISISIAPLWPVRKRSNLGAMAMRLLARVSIAVGLRTNVNEPVLRARKQRRRSLTSLILSGQCLLSSRPSTKAMGTAKTSGWKPTAFCRSILEGLGGCLRYVRSDRSRLCSEHWGRERGEDTTRKRVADRQSFETVHRTDGLKQTIIKGHSRLRDASSPIGEVLIRILFTTYRMLV